MKLNYKIFKKIYEKAKYQLVLKAGNNVYFLYLNTKDTYFDNEGVIAHNENTGAIEIVYYKEIDEIIIDGETICIR